MKKLSMIFLGSLSVALSATAQAGTSQYSDFNVKKCKQVGELNQEDGGGTWECPGIKGLKVIYSEGDLRGTMAFGESADIQCASAQSFGHFNSPGDKIEWRLNDGKPYATILRWFTDNGEPDSKQNWLVVTKINSDEVCRTAIIDTQTPNANVVARQKADQSVSFKCTKDLPELISAKSLKVDEVMSGVPCSPE
jgi:hypothetical protein